MPATLCSQLPLPIGEHGKGANGRFDLAVSRGVAPRVIGVNSMGYGSCIYIIPIVGSIPVRFMASAQFSGGENEHTLAPHWNRTKCKLEHAPRAFD